VIMNMIDKARAAGCSQERACKLVGISERTIQRWRARPNDDGRRGPKSRPANALSSAERQRVLSIVNSPEFRDLSPKQIAPRLADRGEYAASESTMYRILRQEQQLAHRGRARSPTPHRPDEHVAGGPNEVFSWDITYMRAVVAGTFFYLYMILDIWSRKIVGWEVHETQCPELAAKLANKTCAEIGVNSRGIVLHSDNGGPMKGSTMLATLERLGVIPSFSRPRVSDDNPFSEALFRTLKYRPWYPSRPFQSLEHAREWVSAFVHWYNTEHRHSGLRYVTPEERHSGREHEVFSKRRLVYANARQSKPNRWTGTIRNWTPVGDVHLNPKPRGKENTQANLPSDLTEG
jgi:putative transposase